MSATKTDMDIREELAVEILKSFGGNVSSALAYTKEAVDCIMDGVQGDERDQWLSDYAKALKGEFRPLS